MKIEKYWIPGVLIALLIFCFVAIFFTQSYGDELVYHFPLAQKIGVAQILDPHSDYSSAYTPLPYLIAHSLLKIVPSLMAVRILNYIVFLLSLWVFFSLVGRYSGDPWSLTLLYALNPYFLLSSIIFYLYNWGPFFALLGLYFYLHKKRFFLACMFLAFSVLSQQWMLAVVAAVLLNETLCLARRCISLQQSAARAALLITAMAPVILLFWNWGGLVHPNFASHRLQPGFEHLSAVLSHLGFLLFFLVVARTRDFMRRRYVPFLFLLPLLWLAIPAFASNSDPQVITGFLPHAAMKLELYLHVPYRITMFLLSTLGLGVLALLVQKTDDLDRFVLAYSSFGLICALVASARLATANIFNLLPLLLLFFGKDIAETRRVKALMIFQSLVVGIVLLLYFVFLRSKNVLL